jgi:hypothetical protein
MRLWWYQGIPRHEGRSSQIFSIYWSRLRNFRNFRHKISNNEVIRQIAASSGSRWLRLVFSSIIPLYNAATWVDDVCWQLAYQLKYRVHLHTHVLSRPLAAVNFGGLSSSSRSRWRKFRIRALVFNINAADSRGISTISHLVYDATAQELSKIEARVIEARVICC